MSVTKLNGKIDVIIVIKLVILERIASAQLIHQKSIDLGDIRESLAKKGGVEKGQIARTQVNLGVTLGLAPTLERGLVKRIIENVKIDIHRAEVLLPQNLGVGLHPVNRGLDLGQNH